MENRSGNLSRYARDAASGIGLPRFWRWWKTELAPVVPAASRRALKRWRMRPVIEFGEREAVFWRPEIVNGEIELAAMAKAPLTGDQADVAAVGRAAMASIGADAQGNVAARPPQVVVALPPRQVMRKRLVLPAAVEENLAQALSYDLDRHTPFRPDQLYFDAVVVDRDTARKTITVDWAAALKTAVDGARRQAEAWGASVQAVVPGPASTLPPRLNLIPVEERSRAGGWRRWQVWVPLVLVAGIALATVVVPLLQKREYAIELNKQAEEARVQALAADAIRTQLERAQGEYNFVLAKKYAYPGTVQLLDGVTRVLPDDTWITQLEMRTSLHGKETQRDLVLRGESANAGKLIGLLEDSKLVEQAALR
jgi:general secretion pathway protein L